jgi:hypothetical protein
MLQAIFLLLQNLCLVWMEILQLITIGSTSSTVQCSFNCR